MKTKNIPIILGVTIFCSFLVLLTGGKMLSVATLIFLSLTAWGYYVVKRTALDAVNHTFELLSKTIEEADINKTEKVILFSYLSRDPHIAKEKVEISLKEKEWDSVVSEKIAEAILKFVNLRIKHSV